MQLLHRVAKSFGNWKRNGIIFRQTSDQDFGSLPDPFAGYIDQLDPADMDRNKTVEAATDSNKQIQINADEGLDHIEDPEMQSLMQREIAR